MSHIMSLLYDRSTSSGQYNVFNLKDGTCVITAFAGTTCSLLYGRHCMTTLHKPYRCKYH